jgi:hypothetical protein
LSRSEETVNEDPVLEPGSLAPVIPVEDLGAAVLFWEAALGGPPTFVDGTRWAQFDLGGRRLALAGTDRATDRPSVMLKAPDLAVARERLTRLGATLGPVEAGPHESRFLAQGGGPVDIVVYSPGA